MISEDIDEITDQVIARLRERYYLIEREPTVRQIDVKEGMMLISSYISNKEGMRGLDFLTSPSKLIEYCRVRDIIIYLIRQIYGESISYVKIGLFMKRDHSTIKASYRKTIGYLGINKPYKAKLDDYYNEVKQLIVK